MKDFQIKIKILERVYPLKINPAEEESLRTAGKELENRIKVMKRQTGAIDAQDLLAMVAFGLMAEAQKHHSEKQSTVSEIEAMKAMIENTL